MNSKIIGLKLKRMINKLKHKYHRLNSTERLYNLKKPIVAITGGIATGKSTVSNILKQKGFKIIDADQLVKTIYQTEEAKIFVKEHLGEAWVRDEINFKILREIFFSNPNKKKLVEKFIYSRLPSSFLETAKEITNQDFYFYDVPLLFEKNLNQKVDVTVLVYANESLQIDRILSRDKCSEEVAKKILSQQMNIEDKKEKADFVINNAGSFEDLSVEVDLLLSKLMDPAG